MEDRQIIKCVSDSKAISLKALDGSRFIYQANNIFKSVVDKNFVSLGLNKPGVATLETLIKVHEILDNVSFLDIFSALPGLWEQKYLSQDQAIEFCETWPDWFRRDGSAVFFLIKKDENKSINEDYPQDNSVVISVFAPYSDWRVRIFPLVRAYVCLASPCLYIVTPKLD